MRCTHNFLRSGTNALFCPLQCGKELRRGWVRECYKEEGCETVALFDILRDVGAHTDISRIIQATKSTTASWWPLDEKVSNSQVASLVGVPQGL